MVTKTGMITGDTGQMRLTAIYQSCVLAAAEEDAKCHAGHTGEALGSRVNVG